MVIRHLKAEDQAVFLAFCQDFYSGGAVLHAVDPDNFRRTFEACVSGNPILKGSCWKWTDSRRDISWYPIPGAMRWAAW